MPLKRFGGIISGTCFFVSMGMAFEGIEWHTVEYCVNLIVLRTVLKKKRTVSFFLNMELE